MTSGRTWISTVRKHWTEKKTSTSSIATPGTATSPDRPSNSRGCGGKRYSHLLAETGDGDRLADAAQPHGDRHSRPRGRSSRTAYSSWHTMIPATTRRSSSVGDTAEHTTLGVSATGGTTSISQDTTRATNSTRRCARTFASGSARTRRRHG